jgi:HAD superfamily hydrolase (TIGR01509 family)
MTGPGLHAVIFDLDGTLVDSRLDFAAMRLALGAPDDIGLLEYVESLPSADMRERAMEVIHRHEIAGAEEACWMPGAEAVLHLLHRQGTPVAIVTRNSRHAARLTMERLGMPAIPLRAREDAAPKPDPEALLAFAEEWSLAPSLCAYVGDFRYDVEAAERAGMVPILYVGEAEAPVELAGRARKLTTFEALFEWIVVP